MNEFNLDEPYCDPSDADEIFETAKRALIDAATEGVKEYYANAAKENERQQSRIDDLSKRLGEALNGQRVAESSLRDLQHKFDNLTIEAVFGRLSLRMWRVAFNWSESLPKCDQCNDDRNVVFMSPRGRECSEDCACTDTHKVYFADSIDAIKAGKRDGRFFLTFYTMDRWGDMTKDRFYDGDVFNGEAFSEIKKGSIFATESDCAAYCDWLNEFKQ